MYQYIGNEQYEVSLGFRTIILSESEILDIQEIELETGKIADLEEDVENLHDIIGVNLEHISKLEESVDIPMVK